MAIKPEEGEKPGKEGLGTSPLLLLITLFCILTIAFFAFSFLTQFFQNPEAPPASTAPATANIATPYSFNGIREPTQKTNASQCMASLGVPSSKIVEIYSQTCPRSQAMKPSVRTLETRGIRFERLDIMDAESQKTINECLGELISGYTPQFICLKKNTELTGEVPLNTLDKFVSDCQK